MKAGSHGASRKRIASSPGKSSKKNRRLTPPEQSLRCHTRCMVIKQRTKDAARGMLHAVLDELSLLPRADLAGAFAEKAREMSDTPGDSIPSHIPSHNSQLLFS